MFDRVVLSRDLVDVGGVVLGTRGLEVTVTGVKAAAQAARPLPRSPLSGTPIADDLYAPLAEPAYRHLFRDAEAQAAVARALLAVRVPQPLFDELAALRSADPVRYRHALATAAVTVRMLLAAVGDAPGLSDVAAAGLLHDLGMRHVPERATPGGGLLAPCEAKHVAAHPVLGAWHLAAVLGPHLAVDAALGHHWRNGSGYPVLPVAPSRSVQVVGVASAFVALTQARCFRSGPFDARGAADVLVAEAHAGCADAKTVRLLVHALRGGQGGLREVRLSQSRRGRAPGVNRHAHFTAPMLA